MAAVRCIGDGFGAILTKRDRFCCICSVRNEALAIAEFVEMIFAVIRLPERLISETGVIIPFPEPAVPGFFIVRRMDFERLAGN